MVSSALGNDMVVQRDQSLSVWGWTLGNTQDGKYVKVDFKGETAYGLVENGQWKATFDKTFPASNTPSDIVITSANGTTTISRVLVGDVYWVIGQSNCWYSMGKLYTDLTNTGNMSFVDGIAFTDDINIRLFRNSNLFYSGVPPYQYANGKELTIPSPQASWKTPYQGVVDFSALGYLFAFHMNKALDIPIGMMMADASGCPITTFAPGELATKWGSDYLNPNTGLYCAKLGSEEYGNAIYIDTLPSRGTYDCQIAPLKNFNVAGLLWYQGESDNMNLQSIFGAQTKWTFTTEFADLMTYYRNNFGDGTNQFPVYLMEFPACYPGANNAYIDFGMIRSELGTIPNLLEDCYVVSSSDVWYDSGFWENIHPYCKPFQAARAAAIALANEHNIGDIDSICGPNAIMAYYKNNYKTAVVEFEHVGDGIIAATKVNGLNDISGIEICIGNNYFDAASWIPATDVRIVDGDTIEINCDREIYAIRYNAGASYSFRINVNLCNSVNGAENTPMAAWAFYR